jgi:hypothetical protein
MRLFLKILLAAGLVASIAVVAAEMDSVKAQTTQLQPFTAIQVSSSGEGPSQHTYARGLAVRANGVIATAQEWRIGRDVIRVIYDPNNKTETMIDTKTKTIVDQPYHPDRTLQGDQYCAGPFDGQIEGFDVVLTQRNVTIGGNGEEGTEKYWAAPKLGCFVLKKQMVSVREEQRRYDNVCLLTNIQVGEPDPSYFELDSAKDYTSRTDDEWMELAIPWFKKAAGQ